MLSSRLWVVSGQEVIKECTNNCMIFKKKAPFASQFMISFPQIGLKFKIMVFSNISIENFWAAIDKIRTRKNSNEKMCSLCCLFMCLSSGAVHLEMKFGLNATVFSSGI